MATWPTPLTFVDGPPPVDATTLNQQLRDPLTILGGPKTPDPRASAAIWTTTSALVGNGTLVSRYRLVGTPGSGCHLDWEIGLTFGSSSNPGSGQFTFAYPAGFTAKNPGSTALVRLFDSSGPTTYLAVCVLNAATVNLQSITSAAGVLSSVTAGAPFTWGANDVCAFLISSLEGI